MYGLTGCTTEAEYNALRTKLLDCNYVSSVSFTEDTTSMFGSLIGSLNYVVVLIIVCAAALAAAGMVPAPGAMQQFYVLLPYAGALVAGISAVWALARMSRGGARLRSYVYEETVAKLPLRCLLTGVFAALAAVGECMDMFLNGGQGAIWYAVLFAALAAAAAAAAFAAGHTIRAAVYTEESDSGREE